MYSNYNNFLNSKKCCPQQNPSYVGCIGPQGPLGPTGPGGSATNTGATGPPGVTGPTGPQGTPGTSSGTGATGYTGPTGPQGTPGLGGIVSNYGQFYWDGTTPLINPFTLQWPNTYISSGISATGTNSTEIRVSTAGTYYFENRVQASPDTEFGSGGANFNCITKFYINGTILITNSQTTETIGTSPAGGGSSPVFIASTLVNLLANEYITITIEWSGSPSGNFPFNNTYGSACVLKVFQLAYNGPTGNTGPTGFIGYTGPCCTGPTGPQSTVTGPTGPAGVAGSASNIVASYYINATTQFTLSSSPLTLAFPDQVFSPVGITATQSGIGTGATTTFTITKTGYYEIAFNTTITTSYTNTPANYVATSEIYKGSSAIPGSKYITNGQTFQIQNATASGFSFPNLYHANAPFITLLLVGDVISVKLSVDPNSYGQTCGYNFISIKQVAADIGSTGYTGPTGPQSTVTGPTGRTGPTGPQSTVTGPTGPQSTVTGPTGPAGSVTGPVYSSYVQIPSGTTPYTIPTSVSSYYKIYYIVYVNISGGPTSIYLPPAGTCPGGWIIVCNKDSFAVNVYLNPADGGNYTIPGSEVASLTGITPPFGSTGSVGTGFTFIDSATPWKWMTN
jgi:hypothetical protein